MREDLAQKTKIIDYQEGRINYLQKKLDIANDNIIQIEERQLANNIVVSGMPESAEEDIYESLNLLFKEKLQIPNDITLDTSYRLGANAPRGDKKPRPVVAKLALGKDKQTIFANARRLRGSSMFICDQQPDAVRCNQNLLLEQRKEILTKCPGGKVTVRGERLMEDGPDMRDMKIEEGAQYLQ